MAWFNRKKKQDPLTPWEAYQAKQARAKKKAHRQRLFLPNVTNVRKHTRRRNLALVLTPLILLLGFFGYMVSPLSKVGAITVTGESTVPAQHVINASQLSNADVVLDLVFHKQRVTQRIERHLPEIRTAQVSIQRGNQVTLHVGEYSALGYVLSGTRYHLILASGKILSTSTTTPLANYPIFIGFTTKAAVKMARQVGHFPAAGRRAVSEVRATHGAANPYQVTLSMSDGNTVVADSRTVVKRIQYYPSIVAQVNKKGTVDLEVGAFFKPYTTKSSTSSSVSSSSSSH